MIQQNKGDIHLFTTNHPWFLEIGLSSFTTGTLIDWWNQKTADGRYLNRRHINSVSSSSETLFNPPNDLRQLLGITTGTEFFWDGWKPNQEIPNAGRFKKQNLKGASGNTGGSDEDKWKYKTYNIDNAIVMKDLEDNGILYAMSLKQDGVYGIETYYNQIVDILDINDHSYVLREINPLYSLIQLNKWMVFYQNYFPKKLWDNSQNTLIPDWALLTEIKSSKAGSSLQWSGPVTFYVDNGVFDKCSITETVVFNLYLGNESMMKSGNNAITIKNLTIVGPKVDAIGSNRGIDGERSVSNTTDTAAQTAAPLDVQYNSVTRKYQSGNKNVLAKLTTDLKAAVNSPALVRLLTSEAADDLADEKNTYSFIPSSGLAMPINAQNSMPSQWYPTYELTTDARCSSTGVPAEKNKKIVVPVFNFNSRRFYPSGEDVLLTEIDGIWHVSSLGEANATPTDVVKTSVGKWGAFTYMATSSQFFFQGKRGDGTPVSVTPRSAELNFHKLYYKNRGYDQPLNSDTDYGAAGGYDTDAGASFNTSTHEEWTDEPGWFQTTSFDYLDSQIFGIRGQGGSLAANGDVCSISSTSATLNAAGKPISNDDYTTRNSAHTGTFFGCVFPAGYQGTEVYDQPRAWIVGAASKGSTSYPNEYFKTDGLNANNVNPFLNDPERNNSNVKCLSTEGDPLATISAGGNKWARAKSKRDASLFELGAVAGRKTIPADVMLNASPDGTYGSPIKPIGLFKGMNTTGVKTNQYIADLVTGGVWLNKVADTETININDSAFDFKPRVRDNLMFRPLKLEAYLQFGLPTGHIQYGQEQGIAADKTLDGLYGVQTTVQGFYAEAARTQINNSFPISYYAADREQDNCSSNRIGPAGGALKWGAWVPNKINYSRIHQAGYWSTSPVAGGMNWTTKEAMTKYPYNPISNWNGAGVYGVIATSNKVSANTSIGFTTQNLYGMSAAGGDTAFGNAISDYIKVPQKQDKTWGVGNLVESYKQENIIDLSVRIYQGHDSSSTVYDPRYFAVHHFNPGVEFLDNMYRGTGGIPVNALGTSVTGVRNYLQEDFKNLKGVGGTPLTSVKYNYPQASGVDVKIPSRYVPDHTQGGVFYPVTLPTGTFVFSDATSIGPPIMSEKYWNVETRRTGKLLPYRYEVSTLTIPADIGEEILFVPEPFNLTKTVFELGNKLIVENFGSGYKVGDIVGISELNIVLEVMGIIETASDAYKLGEITRLKVINGGENLPPSFCMPFSMSIGSLTPTYKVTTIALISGSTGKDFEAYFVCSQVRAKTKCDPKPFLIKQAGTEIIRIASDKSGPSHPTTGDSGPAEGLSYISENRTVVISLGGDNIKSADSTYDIFFHFHNDITMTWLACGTWLDKEPHGDKNNRSESEEQHVTIESINLI
jgi:hypothetical protein